MTPRAPPTTLPAAEPWAPILVTLAVFVTVRALAWPFTDNVFGDSAVRSELAEQWARAPHWIRSFRDGAMQFGPLHLYLVGALRRWTSLGADAGRAVSLFFGICTLVPLWSLTRRYFGSRAAWVACALLSLWGLHIQASTTAASESVSLFFTLCALALYAAALEVPSRLWPRMASAVLLTLACAVRYDTWLLVPLLGGWFAWRTRAWGKAVLFVTVAAAFPIAWMWGNAQDLGDPLYALHFVDAYHREWVPRELGWYQRAFGPHGSLVFRVSGALFWPGAAILTLSPPVAVVCGVGLWSQRRSPGGWLLLPLLVPTAYFAFRAAVQLDFVPLARFTMGQLVLLLAFAGAGLERLADRWKLAPRTVMIFALAFLGAWSAALTAVTYEREDKLASALRPISPVTTASPALRDVSGFLAKTPQGSVILDRGRSYEDVQVGFSSRLPNERQLRLRWQHIESLLAARDPTYVVTFPGGTFLQRPDVSLSTAGLKFRHREFRELPGFAGGIRVFRRD